MKTQAQAIARRRAIALLLLASSTAWPGRQARCLAQDKPAPDPGLQTLLKRFPDADSDNDGVLTPNEARAYRQKLQGAPDAKGRNQKPPVEPTQADVKYGPHDRNVLDFWQAKSQRPTPLIVYIHGGGFVAGDKHTINAQMLTLALDSGISVAAINYRLVDGKDVIFPAPQLDGARAVQFLRSKAAEWNLDPGRVACFGGSAGAGIAMWVAFHNDLANPNSDDPVERQSTRIQAVGTTGGQSTYDPIKIKELIGGRAWAHPSIFKVYGVTTADEALHPTPERQKLYDETSAIMHLTKDDPPLFMVYNEPDEPLPSDAKRGQGIHHPNFGKLLKTQMQQLGIENVYVHTDEAKGRNLSREMLEFFQKQFATVK